MVKSRDDVPERRRAQPAAEKFETLRSVIEAISSELALRPLLTSVVRHACDLLGADRGTIGLVDRARDLVRTEATYRMPDGELGAEMARGQGLAGRVLETGQPVVMRYGDVRDARHPQIFEDSVIGMPIVTRGEMIGFFGIGAAPPTTFRREQVELLQDLSRHVAIAIENARLFESEQIRRQRMNMVGRIGRMITQSLSLDEILSTAVQEIHNRLGYNTVGLFLVSPDNPDRLVLRSFFRAGPNADVGDHSQRVDEGVVGQAAMERRAVLVSDSRSRPDYMPIPGGEHLVSELALPIVADDRLLGVLNVEDARILDEDDKIIMEVIADQLGIAIENARLFQEARQTLEEVELLYETSRRMSMAGDIDGIVDAYLSQVAARGRFVCSIGLTADTGVATLRVVGRWSPNEGLSHPQEQYVIEGATDSPLLGPATVLIRDVEHDPRLTEKLRRIQLAAGRRALAVIPLVIRGKRLGIVSLSYHEPYEWSDTDTRTIEITAAQLAATVHSRQQRQRFRARDQQLAVVNERQRLARDLHDSVSQIIFSMTLFAQSIGPAMRDDVAEGERRVEHLLNLGRSARAEMRALLHELKESEPDEVLDATSFIRTHGLAQALREHLGGVPGQGPEVRVDMGNYTAQSARVEEALYRIALEGVTNALKHAQADGIDVSLALAQDTITLQVADDGVGMDYAKEDRPGEGDGLGLANMRERAEGIDGRLTLESKKNAGTRVTAVIPVTGER